jgi:hypothetical protein
MRDLRDVCDLTNCKHLNTVVSEANYIQLWLNWIGENGNNIVVVKGRILAVEEKSKFEYKYD